MSARHLLSITQLDPEILGGLVADSAAIAAGTWTGGRSLTGKVVGIYFKKTSTRTRTAFTVGALKLGASIIAYGPADLQLLTGETLGDTARVLANYLDIFVVRTAESLSDMKQLGEQGRMAIINALSHNEHPTQALADLSTLREAFGRLDGLHVLYLGEGNCSAASLALAVGMTRGMQLTLVTPEGYGLSSEVLAQAQAFATQNGALIEQHSDPSRLPRGVDAVYTSRWLEMGVPKGDPDWLTQFRPYAVTEELMAQVSKPAGTVFLHDLPAMRGHEVADEVLDGARSIAFRQAYHKMTSAMSVLSWCAANG